MNWNLIIQFILYSAITFQVIGQDSLINLINQPYRLEIEQGFSDNDIIVISLKRNGLALLQEKMNLDLVTEFGNSIIWIVH